MRTLEKEVKILKKDIDSTVFQPNQKTTNFNKIITNRTENKKKEKKISDIHSENIGSAIKILNFLSESNENLKEIQKGVATTTNHSTSTQENQKNDINDAYNKICKENFLKECQKVVDEVALDRKFAFVMNFN